MLQITKITPRLWYAETADEAASFYVSVLPDSHIDNVTVLPAKTPDGSAESVRMIEFTLAGQQVIAVTAKPMDASMEPAACLVVGWEDEAEVERLSEALSDGGVTEDSGCVRDRYGISWQIVRRRRPEDANSCESSMGRQEDPDEEKRAA